LTVYTYAYNLKEQVIYKYIEIYIIIICKNRLQNNNAQPHKIISVSFISSSNSSYTKATMKIIFRVVLGKHTL